MLTLLLVASACAAPSTQPPAQSALPPAGFWDHWGDGRAEVAGYELVQPRYGELRHGEAVLIYVTETFTGAQSVKSDGDHADEFPVIKLNEIRDFQTGIYDYNGMTSTFLPLDGRLPAGLPTKVTFSLQEWCGHVYEQLNVEPTRIRRTLHSYFDGEADRAEALERPDGGVLEDAMPLLVRGFAGELLRPGESRQVAWLPRRLDVRMHHGSGAWTTAELSRSSGAEPVEVPAGRFLATRFTARSGPSTTTWFVEVDPPHRLLLWEKSDGERGTLLGADRIAYWRHSAEGNETLRGRAGLPSR